MKTATPAKSKAPAAKPTAKPPAKPKAPAKPKTKPDLPSAAASCRALFDRNIQTRVRCEKITWGRDGYPKRCEKQVLRPEPGLRAFCRPHTPAALAKTKFRPAWGKGSAPTNPIHTSVARMLAARHAPVVRARIYEGKPQHMLLSVEGADLGPLVYDNKRALVYAVLADPGNGDPPAHRDLTWDELIMCRDLGLDTIFPFDWTAIRPPHEATSGMAQ